MYVEHGTLRVTEPGSGGPGPVQKPSLESLTPTIQMFSLHYENPCNKKGNCCYFCNKYTCMHGTEICFVLAWILAGKFSLQLLRNPNLHTPTPAPPRPCAVPSSSTSEDSQHGEAYGLAPYAISNEPHCARPATVHAQAAAGRT